MNNCLEEKYIGKKKALELLGISGKSTSRYKNV
jgi:hypothetical protein